MLCSLKNDEIVFRRIFNDLGKCLCIENVPKEIYQMLAGVINLGWWDYECLKITSFWYFCIMHYNIHA